VLKIAKISRALETFIDKNCIKGKTIAIKIAKYSSEKNSHDRSNNKKPEGKSC